MEVPKRARTQGIQRDTRAGGFRWWWWTVQWGGTLRTQPLLCIEDRQDADERQVLSPEALALLLDVALPHTAQP